MIIETTIICITALLITSGLIWLAHHFVHTAQLNQSLRKEFNAAHSASHEDIEKFKKIILINVQTIADNQTIIDNKIKAIETATKMGGNSRSLLDNIREQMSKTHA